MPAFFARAISDQVEPNVFHELVTDLAAAAYIDDNEFRDLVCRGFAVATHAVLADGVLTEANESRIKGLASVFGLTANEFAGGAGTRLVKAAILRDLMMGKFISRIRLDSSLPINLNKAEQLVWVFQGVGYYTTHTKTEYVGGSAGFSVRLMKGVSVRSSSFRGHPIKKELLSLESVGTFVVATANVYFISTSKALKV